MAEGSVRKSGRPRKRTSYLEDEFRIDCDMDLDVSDILSNTLAWKSKKRETRNTLPKKRKRSEPTMDYELGLAPSSLDSSGCELGQVSAHYSNGAEEYVDDGTLDAKNADEGKKSKVKEVLPRSGGFTCEICEKVCVDLAAYKRHIKCHSSDRKYKCEICHKAFIDSCSLKRHMKIHDDERPFTCDLCFKSFRDGPSLARHQQTHVERPRVFSCSTCGKGFADKHGLTRHERTHSGLRPFECSICHKTFSESGSFKRHEKIHIGIRKFSCIVCGKRFLEKQSLLRHQRVVCGVMEDTTKTNSTSSSEADTLQTSYSSLNSSGVEDYRTREPLPPNNTKSQKPESEFVNPNAPTMNSIAGPMSKSPSEAVSSSVTVDEEPSLQSLMKKDPNLYAGISDLVDSIDSYEQMLDLCGDSGHSQIDAALTRDQPPMPDNLLCFECGEHLVDGENFRKEGKVFRLPLRNQFRCLICEEDDNKDKDGPPVLSAAVSPLEDSYSPTDEPQDDNENILKQPSNESYISETTEVYGGEEKAKIQEIDKDGNEKDGGDWKDVSVFGNGEGGSGREEVSAHEKDESEVKPNAADNQSEPHTDHLQERLGAEHGTYFLGEMYPHLLSSFTATQEDTDSTTATSTNASVSRSSSTEGSEPYGQDFEVKVNFAAEAAIASETPHTLMDKKNPKSERMKESVVKAEDKSHSSDLSKTSESPKLEYAADDTSIPSVFPCHLCTKVFASSAFLSRHLDLHKNSPHKCTVCGKTFTNAVSLKRHVTTHTGEKPYACPNCSKRFRDQSNFSKHKKICKVPPYIPTPTAETSSFMPFALASPLKAEDIQAAYTRSSSPTSEVETLQQGNPAPDDRTGEGPVSPYTAPVSPDAAPVSRVSPDATPVASPDGQLSDDIDDEDANLSVTFGEPSQESVSQSLLETDTEINSHLLEESEYQGMAELSQSHSQEPVEAVHCGVCEKSFSKEKDLQLHMRYHTAENPDLTCEECGKSFNDSNSLKRHIRIHAETRPHVCEFCGRGYCDNWSLRKHQSRGCLVTELQVPASFMVPCPQCNRVFSTESLQQEHIVAVHKGALKYECDVCMKRFSEAYNLKRHRRLHMAVCPGCEQEFKNVKLLSEHQKTDCPGMTAANIGPDTNDKDKFSCPECGRGYTTKANLERHKKFHSALKPHVCEICNRRFSEAFKLKRHMKVHSDSKPYKCKNCTKGFVNMQGLRQHLLKTKCLAKTSPPPAIVSTSSLQEMQTINLPTSTVSSSSSEFPCQICGKVFSKKFLLVRHMNVHSVEKPYICGQCGRSYKDTSSLKRHCLVHRGVKDFVCPQCGKAFFYLDSLRRHQNGLCGKRAQFEADVVETPKKRRRKGKKKKKNKLDVDALNSGDGYTSVPVQPSLEEQEVPQQVTQIPATDSDVQQNCEEPQSVLLPRCPIRLPAKPVAMGPWSCRKGRYCWQCSVRLPSNALLLEHARIHRHKKPYLGRFGFHRWSKKQYLATEKKALLSSCAFPQPEVKPSGLKIKLKMFNSLVKEISGDTIKHAIGGDQQEETENSKDLFSRPRRSLARAKWSWLSQIN